MKKFFIFALSLLCLNAYANGDGDNAPVSLNRPQDNIFVGGGIGVNTILDNGFLGKSGLGLDAYAGKWFTPSTGIRLGWHGLSNQAVDTSNGWFAGEDSFSYNFAHIDWVWDILNSFSYKPNRVVNPRVGVQAGCIFTGHNGIADQEFGMGPFAQVSFRLGRRLELGVEATMILAREEAYRNAGKLISFPSVSATVAVNIGKVGFERKVKTVVETVEVIRDCGHGKEMEDLLRQLDSLKSLRAQAPEVVKEYTTRPDIVYFDLDKDRLTRRELAHLEFLMGQLPEGAELYIVGHADKETGNPRHNLSLSQRRSETVAKTLRSWGYPAELIHTDWRGDTGNIQYGWDKQQKNRCCCITVVLH